MSRGRPTVYRPEFAKQAKQLCKLGATDIEVAQFFGVAQRTVHRWKAEHADFCHALKTGKTEADERVVRSLYQRASGYTHEAEKIFCSKDGVVTRAKCVEHFPPDTTACIFWLKNRRPEAWRDVKDVSVNGTVSVKHLGLQEVRDRTEFLLGRGADSAPAPSLLQ